jgi:PAS domain S-box-containing protein
VSDLQDIDLFKSIFQSSSEGIIVVDLDGIIIKANSASENLFGYKAGELIKQKVECLIPNKFKKNHELFREKYKVKPIVLNLGPDLEL